MLTASVKLPTGDVTTARIGGIQATGYRTASVRVTDSDGQRVRVSGRVSTRHGFDGRVLPFEVNLKGINARSILERVETDLYI